MPGAKQMETGVNKSTFHANSILFIWEEKLLLSKTYNLLNKLTGLKKIEGAKENKRAVHTAGAASSPLAERLGMSLHERCYRSWQQSLLYLLSMLFLTFCSETNPTL